jgi:hypothetical protein
VSGRVRANIARVHIGELISVLLREDLADEAWSTAAGEPEQVSESQWLQLISLRESEHPADVLGPLSRLIELGIDQPGDTATRRRSRPSGDSGKAMSLRATPPVSACTWTDCGSASGASTRLSPNWTQSSGRKVHTR